LYTSSPEVRQLENEVHHSSPSVAYLTFTKDYILWAINSNNIQHVLSQIFNFYFLAMNCYVITFLL
jgi:hypothetical protein